MSLELTAGRGRELTGLAHWTPDRPNTLSLKAVLFKDGREVTHAEVQVVRKPHGMASFKYWVVGWKGLELNYSAAQLKNIISLSFITEDGAPVLKVEVLPDAPTPSGTGRGAPSSQAHPQQQSQPRATPAKSSPSPAPAEAAIGRHGGQDGISNRQLVAQQGPFQAAPSAQAVTPFQRSPPTWTQVAAAGWSGGSGLLAFQNPLGWSATQILTSPFSAPPNVSPLRGSPHAASMQGLGPGQSPAAPATAPVAPYNSPFQQNWGGRPWHGGRSPGPGNARSGNLAGVGVMGGAGRHSPAPGGSSSTKQVTGAGQPFLSPSQQQRQQGSGIAAVTGAPRRHLTPKRTPFNNPQHGHGSPGPLGLPPRSPQQLLLLPAPAAPATGPPDPQREPLAAAGTPGGGSARQKKRGLGDVLATDGQPAAASSSKRVLKAAEVPGAAAAAADGGGGGGASSSGGTGVTAVTVTATTSGPSNRTPAKADNQGQHIDTPSKQVTQGASQGLQDGAAGMLGPDHQQKQHHHQQQQQQQQDEQQLLLQQARAAHVDRLGRAVDLVLMAATALQHQELLQGVAHMRDCLRAWDLTQVERMLDGIPWAQVQDWCRQLVQAAGGPQQADADMQQRAAMAAAAAEGITAVIGAGGPPPALGGAGPGGPGPQQQLQPLVANYEQLYQHVSWLRILTAAGPGAVSLAAAARQRYDLFGGIDATHTYVSCLLFSPAPGPLQAAGPALDAAMQHVAYDMQLGLVAGYAGTCPDVPWRDVAYLLHTYQGAVDGALGSTLVQEGDVGIALHLAHQRQLGFHLVALGGLCNVLQDRAWEAVATNPDMQPYLKRMADAAAAVQANRQILAQTRPLAGYHGEPKPGYTLAFTQGHAPQLVETVVAEPGAPVLQLLLLSLLGVGGYGSVWMIQPLGEEAWRQLLGLPPGAALPRELAVKLPIASKKARDGTPAKECDDWRVGRSLDRLLAEANREVRALQRLRMLPYVTDLLAVGLVQLRVAPTEGAAPEEVELPMLVMEASLGSMWDLQHNQGPLGVAPAVFPDGKVPEPFIKYFLLAQLVAKVGMGVLRVLHRDWKTANLLVSWANGRLRVKVSDLGLGKLLDGMDASLPPLTHAGTPGHVGPEVIHGRVQGHSMDMFSIGITGLEMAYGQSPLRGLQHWARPGEDVVDPAAMDVLRSWLGQAHEGISDPLLDFCTWLCSQDPVKRPSAFKAICSQFFAQ